MTDTVDPEKTPLLEVDRSCNPGYHPSTCPDTEQAKPTSVAKSKILLLVILLFTIKGALLLGWSVHRYRSPQTAQTQNGNCAQPASGGTPSNWTELYNYDGFAKESAERLAGAVRIPTQSFDDMEEPGKDDRWKPFDDMKVYLSQTFPTVHEKAALDLVNSHSMVYTLEGTDHLLKPLMLTGHLDVVPATTSLNRWTYPPFDGVVEEEWIYGRGTSDCKNNVIGIMTALEYMLKNGWKPTRTIVAAFGMDEEVGGERGATSISAFLEDKYGPDGIAMIVDEGGMGIETLYGTQFALPGMAEKGYGNFIIEVDMAGGHSSIPSKHTSIGILPKIVSQIEDSDLFEPDMRQTSPMWGYLQCVATHGDKSVPAWMKDAVRSKRPNLGKVGQEFALVSPANRYLVQTSKAATVISGGNKVNALPESAVVTINSRIDLYSDVSEVSDAYLSIIEEIGTTYNLAVNGNSATTGALGNITLTVDQPGPPSPITPTDSAAFEVFAKAVQAAFGGDVVTAPSSMTGNTDTRHYVNLTRHIYRWSPTKIGTRLNAHTVDEKIKIDTHVDAIRFYTELLVQADSMGSGL